MSKRTPAEFIDWPAELDVEFGPFRAVCKYIVDGDTADFFIDFGMNEYRYHPGRILGVDCPEKNRPATRAAGLAAMEYTAQVMPPGTRVVLDTRPDPDSFGRYLVRVRLPGGYDLATMIINAGHGVPR